MTSRTKKLDRSGPSQQKAKAKAEEIKVVEPELVGFTPAKKGSKAKSTEKALAPIDPLARYLAEVKKYALLTREDEEKWAIKYKETGDAKAAEILVTANLRFVVKIAAEYSKFGTKMIDLIQEGNVGLMHAVREFNPYKGVRLITYAVWWIRGYIQEYLMRQYSMVRIGTTQSQRKLFYQLKKKKKELEQMGLEANVAQLSEKLGVPEKDVELMNRRMAGRDLSLNQTVKNSENLNLLDLQIDESEMSAPDRLELQESLGILKEKIDEILPRLNEKEIYLLENRLLADEPVTLQDIGTKYGTSREAVRQMEARLLKKIRDLIMTALSNKSAAE